MEIITLAEYKVFASISSPNQDAQLTPTITFVNELVSSYLGYITDTYETFEEAASIVLLPSSQAVTSITGDLYIDGVLVEDVTIPDFMQIGYKVIFGTPVTGKLLFTVSNKTTNPAIKEACNLLVKYYLKEEYKPNIQSGQEQVESSEPKGLPIYIKNILDLYRES